MIISVLYIYLSYNYLGCSKAKAGAVPTCNLYKIFTYTVYDRIDAAATINFSTQFGAATI